MTIVPDASSTILKFRINHNKSSGYPLLNRAILNSYKSDFSDVLSLRNLILTQYFFAFVSFLLFINGIGCGSTWICAAPVRQILLCKALLILGGFLFILIGDCLAKYHMT